MKKLIIAFLLFAVHLCFAQGISIFFLKDGSIIQGKVVNENQHRIFLKTEQGTIKILPLDIIGREDSSKEGDLSFMSEKLEYLQGNVSHLSGKVTHWNDSLKLAVDDIYELFKNLEVLQNEFEIDLLRLHSQSREHKKKLEYVQDDLTNQRVDIAGNRQGMGSINDTVSLINNSFSKVKLKLDNTSNQSLLLSGNLSNIKNDIQSSSVKQKSQQNQIDMMAGALANQIQEVTRVQGSFSSIEKGILDNNFALKRIGQNLELKSNELALEIASIFKKLNQEIEITNENLEIFNKNALKERKKNSTDLGDLTNEFGILNSKVTEISRDLKVTDAKISTLDGLVDNLDNSIKRVENSIKDMNSTMGKIDNRVSTLKTQLESIPTPEE